MIRLLTAVLLFASFHAVADVTLPNNLEENSVASATDVMDNFNALANEVNSQDSRITIVEESVGGGTTARTFTFNGWVDLVSYGDCSSEQQGDFLNCLGINGLNLRCKSEFGGNYSVARLDVLDEALKYGVPITFPTTGYCGAAVTDYSNGLELVGVSSDDAAFWPYGDDWWLPLRPYIGTPLSGQAGVTNVQLYCGDDDRIYNVSVMCGYWDRALADLYLAIATMGSHNAEKETDGKDEGFLQGA